MRNCTVLISRAWGGWYVHIAMVATKWLLITGIILALFGMVLGYVENMAEIGSR